MKKKQLLTTIALMLLVAVVSVGGTLAYLISEADTVANTFTVGEIKITLDEAKVTAYGVKDGDTRVKENTYKLIPGHTYTKDPTVHVDANSEDCWVYVKIENEIAAIEANSTIATQMADKGWLPVTGATGVYYHKDIQKAGANVVVFDTFTISGTADVAGYEGKTVKITGYAVQADGFAAKPVDAWNATFGVPKA